MLMLGEDGLPGARGDLHLLHPSRPISVAFPGGGSVRGTQTSSDSLISVSRGGKLPSSSGDASRSGAARRGPGGAPGRLRLRRDFISVTVRAAGTSGPADRKPKAATSPHAAAWTPLA